MIVFNDPTDPGEGPFLAFLDAMDAAQVSGIFGDDWLGAAIDGLLVDHLGDPEATDWLSADGTVSYHPLVEDHPLFEGIDGDALMFSDTSTYGTWFTGYSGIPLAETVGEIEGTQGVGVAYAPRTPGSIHLLLGGLALTLSGHSPNDGWAEDAPRFYLNAIAFAAAPGLGSVAGNVSSTGGEPLAATIEVLGTSFTTSTDPADGSYQLALEPGTYTLRVTSFGYAPVEVPVTVEAGEETELDVEMTPGAAGHDHRRDHRRRRRAAAGRRRPGRGRADRGRRDHARRHPAEHDDRRRGPVHARRGRARLVRARGARRRLRAHPRRHRGRRRRDHDAGPRAPGHAAGRGDRRGRGLSRTRPAT